MSAVHLIVVAKEAHFAVDWAAPRKIVMAKPVGDTLPHGTSSAKMTHTPCIYTSGLCGVHQLNLINHLQVVSLHAVFYMISPPPSPILPALRNTPGKPYTENENPALSPKRSFAQHEEDQLSQLELKRRHVHSDAPPSRRAPLDPLSPSDLENKCNWDSQSTDSASYHSLVTPASLPDLQVLRQEHPLRSGCGELRRSGTCDAPIYSWPPPIPKPGTGGSSHNSLVGQRASSHSSGEKKSTRGTFLESASTCHPPDRTTIMTKPIQTVENVPQPVRPCTSSMPSVRRPSEELWRSGAGPTKASHETVDRAEPLVCPTPPGLPPRRPELGRSGSDSDMLPHGSVSLSLALGSQPLRASEHTKAVPPIGAERSRVMSITSFKSHIRNSPMTGANDKSLWCSSPQSPRLDAKWKNEVNTTSLEKQTEAGHASMSRQDLERLLRHAVRNKYSPKITSPLSPLRTAMPAFGLSADPAYQLRMPSQLNNPSPRYSKCPPRRARTVCDGYQSFNLDTTCMHCQECKRDTVCKRLLAFRHRQHQTHHVQRNNKFHAYPARGTNTSVVDDDRVVLANRLREVFAYDMDEEEKSLWEEVAAVTGAGPLSFSRAGGSCAVATHWRAVDDGHDDGTRDDYVDDESLLANESAILFRDVSVY
ncbi:hypothetical protein J3R82DRAFT_11968 [Butyriboletus roseoflavus]|nr:hypothetical protein J3R82DRAFT_11968 [Butyriboletus roseoflavus]